MTNTSASRAPGAMIASFLGLVLSGGINHASAATGNGAAAPQETWIATFYVIIFMLLLIIGFIAAATGQRIWVPYVGLGIAGLVWLGLNEQVSSNVFAPGLDLPAQSVIVYGYANAALNGAPLHHKIAPRASPVTTAVRNMCQDQSIDDKSVL